jgi:hypothetical protein
MTLTRGVVYTRWRRFKGKCSVFCGLQNWNLWLKCDVSTTACLMKNHHTKISFVAAMRSWKRCEADWTKGVLGDHPLVTSRWKTFERVLSAIQRNQCIKVLENLYFQIQPFIELKISLHSTGYKLQLLHAIRPGANRKTYDLLRIFLMKLPRTSSFYIV